MRSRALPLACPHHDRSIDTCGTGGDASGTFNVSTLAAIVIAACGGVVAKHGNRALSSKSGAADVLGALGVRIELRPDEITRCIYEAGIGFMFAPSSTPRPAMPRGRAGAPHDLQPARPLTSPARPPPGGRRVLASGASRWRGLGAPPRGGWCTATAGSTRSRAADLGRDLGRRRARPDADAGAFGWRDRSGRGWPAATPPTHGVMRRVLPGARSARRARRAVLTPRHDGARLELLERRAQPRSPAGSGRRGARLVDGAARLVLQWQEVAGVPVAAPPEEREEWLLNEILAVKCRGRRGAADARNRVEAAARAGGPVRGLSARCAGRPAPVRVIAEIKRASPSAGPIRPAPTVAIARDYARGGAARSAC